MCIVIDMNAVPVVFDESNQEHSNFRPVLRWIRDKEGKIVYGGTTYEQELKRLPRFLRLITQFDKAGKVVKVGRAAVDAVEEELKNLSVCRGFNDCHIVAIVIASGCKLVCSVDRASYRFLRDTRLYPRNARRPSIFSGHRRNAALLCDRNIASICRD